MNLKPKNFHYKRKQKQRSRLLFKNNVKTLIFGNFGLFLLSPIQLTSNQIFRFKLFLKRSFKKIDRTRRFAWFNAFPHLPLTRKPKGVRMGKGKGKLESWFTNIAAGVILIEFQNLRKGRAFYFSKQMTSKLGTSTTFIKTPDFKYMSYPISSRRKFFFTNF
jgi:large subunit ribosomal protein L16